jgi:ADP-ribose pyrophosphatase YjhB (NUDIX family)
MDKELFRNQFLAIIDRDGYTFLREVRCDGQIVSLLPFRIDMETGRMAFLARLEVCPAHGSEFEQCSITGGVDLGQTIEEAAVLELWEEAGYRAEVKELVSLGQVRPSKASDTVVHLFATDVGGKPQTPPPGDGSRFEVGASVEWVDYDRGVQITDPLFVTAMTRLINTKREIFSREWHELARISPGSNAPALEP